MEFLKRFQRLYQKQPANVNRLEHLLLDFNQNIIDNQAFTKFQSNFGNLKTLQIMNFEQEQEILSFKVPVLLLAVRQKSKPNYIQHRIMLPRVTVAKAIEIWGGEIEFEDENPKICVGN